MKRLCFGLALAASGLLVASTAEANLLANPGFEEPEITSGVEVFGAQDWADFGGGTFTVTSAVVPPNSGNQSLKMFGNPSGVFQDFAVAPGTTLDGGAWILNSSVDPLVPGQVAAVNIEWRNAGGDLIDFVSNGLTTGLSPQDEWTFRPVSGTAPDGTSFARFVLITGAFDPDNGPGGGAAFYDDAFLVVREIPEPASVALLGLASVAGLASRRRRG